MNQRVEFSVSTLLLLLISLAAAVFALRILLRG